MREYLHAHESGQLAENTSATVGEYLEQWLANQEPTARKTTFRGYKQDLERVIRCLGHVRLHELTPMQLETAYAEMMKSGSARGSALSAKTVYNAHSSLRKALNDGVRLGVLIRNPATAARPPKRTKPEMDTWTAAQLAGFVRICQTLTTVDDQLVFDTTFDADHHERPPRRPHRSHPQGSR